MWSKKPCRLALQEGYFAEGDSIEQAVQATLMQAVKAGQIRQLPNASFTPTVVTGYDGVATGELNFVE